MTTGRDIVLFDLDGTLVDSAPGIAAALTILRQRRGVDGVSADAVRPLISLGADLVVRSSLNEVAADPAEDLAAFRAILATLPADPASVYPGVAAALAALREAGATLAVLTNKPEGLSRKLLDELGLSSFFEAIAGGDTTPHAKPHRAPVNHVLTLLGASVEHAVFVGDSEVDAATAMLFAMPFLLFTGGYGADAVIDAGVRARFADYGSLPPLVHAFR